MPCRAGPRPRARIRCAACTRWSQPQPASTATSSSRPCGAPGPPPATARSPPSSCGRSGSAPWPTRSWCGSTGPAGGTGPESLVAKLPTADPLAARTAASLGAYEREARFYAELAPRTALSLPAHYGTLPGGALLLEDLSGLEPGDQFHDMPADRLRQARRQLVALQAPFWEDAADGRAGLAASSPGRADPGIVERMERSWAGRRRAADRRLRRRRASGDRSLRRGGRRLGGVARRAVQPQPPRLPRGQPAPRRRTARRARLADRRLGRADVRRRLSAVHVGEPRDAAGDRA